MLIVDTLAPLVLLIALGAALAHIRFLGTEFMRDLNKLAFWITLPSLLFRSAAHATDAGRHTWLLLGVVLTSTIVISVIAWMVSRLTGVPTSARGTLVQSAFRGNLAYIGIPVVAYSTADMPDGASQLMGTAAIVMALTMAFYNVLAVAVLQASRPRASHVNGAAVLRSMFLNPLLLSGLGGLVLPLLGLTLPGFLDETLNSLGSASVPIALLCIGGSLATVPLEGRRLWIGAAALLKVAVLPVVVYVLAEAAGLTRIEERIALVFAAAPTAVASYIMVKQMDGDEALASGAITVSTILSTFSLAAALWFTS